MNPNKKRNGQVPSGWSGDMVSCIDGMNLYKILCFPFCFSFWIFLLNFDTSNIKGEEIVFRTSDAILILLNT